MNEVFREAFGAKLGSDEAKNYAGNDYEIGFAQAFVFEILIFIKIHVFFRCW